ncbi:MAG TPA: alpha/beta hydrolase [Flavisolibacter sp.]|nr:alpha/beta hydrolase [Flavisolibacter sp.]
MTVYFISGLGADSRIFSKLRLPASTKVKYIEWIEPVKHEPLRDYCQRLARQIDKERFILVGLSFGGIAAIEIAKLIAAEQVILLSSIATSNELPLRFRFARLLRLHKLVPARIMKRTTLLIYWFFNARTKKEQALLRDYVRSVSNNFLEWSINAVLNWKDHERLPNLFHIHGDSDRIFPCKRTHADIVISKGGHLMVYDQPAQMSKLLTERINSVDN